MVPAAALWNVSLCRCQGHASHSLLQASDAGLLWWHLWLKDSLMVLQTPSELCCSLRCFHPTFLLSSSLLSLLHPESDLLWSIQPPPIPSPFSLFGTVPKKSLAWLVLLWHRLLRGPGLHKWHQERSQDIGSKMWSWNLIIHFPAGEDDTILVGRWDTDSPWNKVTTYLLKISLVVIPVEESRGQGHAGIPLQSKNQTWISHSLPQRGSTASCRPLWVLEAAHSTPGILLWHGRLPALSRGQSRKGFCSRSRLWYKQHCHVGHTIQLTFWI